MTQSATQFALIAQEPKRPVSRDEMNLAEFPLAVLSTRTDPNLKTLEFSDSIKGKNGELINRNWVITGADKFGLPTASDDEVLLGLLKLTAEGQFTDRKVFFTRYELLKLLRWTTEGRSYSRLQRALDRLSGVRIKTTNGFYDNESKLHSTRNFGIIDAYEINDGRGNSGRGDGEAQATRPSFFVWSDTIFKSFQSGFIKKLDLNFLLDLGSAVSKRLYRYLDKHFWYKAKVQHNLFTLCHEKLGISRNYSYASQLKQQLDPAVEELVKKGFLLGCEYTGKGSGTEVIFYAAQGARKNSPNKLTPLPRLEAVHAKNPAIFSNNDEEESLPALLMKRGIREAQVDKLLAHIDEKTSKRIRKIIAYFDELVSTNSSLVSRSQVGFLYRAIENPNSFVLPGERIDNVKVRPVNKPIKIEVPNLEGEFLSERKRELDKLRAEVEPEMLAKIKLDVETGLVKVRGLISQEKFKHAVEHGIEERLSRLFALPGFEEWKKQRTQHSIRRANLIN